MVSGSFTTNITPQNTETDACWILRVVFIVRSWTLSSLWGLLWVTSLHSSSWARFKVAANTTVKTEHAPTCSILRFISIVARRCEQFWCISLAVSILKLWDRLRSVARTHTGNESQHSTYYEWSSQVLYFHVILSSTHTGRHNLGLRWCAQSTINHIIFA